MADAPKKLRFRVANSFCKRWLIPHNSIKQLVADHPLFALKPEQQQKLRDMLAKGRRWG